MNEPTKGRTRLPATPPIPREDPPGKDGDIATREGYRQPTAAEIGRRTIKVTWGEENYHPVAYNGFKVGGIELVIDVPPNQTIEEAYEQAWERLEAIVTKQQFPQKLDGFIKRLREAGQAVKVAAASK